MSRFRITVSPAAVLLWALLCFFGKQGIFALILPAAMFHELGHVLALLHSDCRLRSLHVAPWGLELRYAGTLGRRQELISALCGPAFGLLLTAATAFCGKRTGSGYLLCLAGTSLLLSLFNLLPCPPLDGWRALRLLCGEQTADTAGLFCSVLLLTAGAFCLKKGFGGALFAAGVTLLLSNAGKWCRIKHQKGL